MGLSAVVTSKNRKRFHQAKLAAKKRNTELTLPPCPFVNSIAKVSYPGLPAEQCRSCADIQSSPRIRQRRGSLLPRPRTNAALYRETIGSLQGRFVRK